MMTSLLAANPMSTTSVTTTTSTLTELAPIATTTTTTSTSTSTKIPHPLHLQFQRSASLRTRIKSNLLTHNNNKNNNRNDSMSTDQVDTVHVNTPITKRQQFTHDSIATGRVSPRRKVVLRSSHQIQTNDDGSLKRSLSLRSKNNKTDTDISKNEQQLLERQEQQPELCTTAALNETIDKLQLNYSENVQEENITNAIDKEVNVENHNDGPTVTGTGVAIEVTNTTNMESGIRTTNNSGINSKKMSLNLNGGSGTATAGATGKSAETTPRTPKTPITTTTTNNYCRQTHCAKQHHHHHHTHNSSTLSTVLETKLTPKTPPVTPDSPSTYLDDDLDSMYSFATTTSGRSTMSCDHPYVARNGTTFSGRKMKYVVHCSNYAGQVGPDYLTPTQRAQRQIRRLKEVLCIARQDLEQKDSEILRLTREVVELRLFKASLSSPEERSASSDAVTVREAELKTSQDVSPIVDMVDDAMKSSPRHIPHQLQTQSQHQQHISSEMQSSFADSGHFEDITTSSVHSKDSYAPHTQDIACGSDVAGDVNGDDDVQAGAAATDCSMDNYELQRQELIRMYEQRIEELIRNQDAAASDMKRSHNDKVEALLQKLAECNTRYADIVPDYEHAKERIRELEKQLEDLQRRLIEHEEKQNKMYLHMYQQGQEAERIARADQALELAHRAPTNKVSINELLHQLQSTQDELENIRAAECNKMNECGSNHALLTAKEAISLWVLGARKTIYRRLLDAQKNRTHVDPEVTLQFLKSAVYYFLTDKENSQGHLQAIQSILEFTESEKYNIDKARTPK